MDGLEKETRKIRYRHFGNERASVNEAEEGYFTLFKTGDQSAFTELYNTLYPSVFYFARRFVLPEEAADITADAFLKLWKMEKHFKQLRSVKMYLQVSVRNACLNYLRREKYREEKLEELFYLSNETTVYDMLATEFREEEIKAELSKKIAAEIDNLPLHSRMVFKMAWLEGLKNKEIANRLGISINTVKTHRKNAMRILRLQITIPELIILLLLLISSIFTNGFH